MTYILCPTKLDLYWRRNGPSDADRKFVIGSFLRDPGSVRPSKQRQDG
jgi:hypothetical protein